MWMFFLVMIVTAGLMFLYEYLGKVNPSKKIKIAKFSVLVGVIATFTFFYAFRALSVGTDTLNYDKCYHALGNNPNWSDIFLLDIGYSLINILCYAVYPSYNFCLVFIGVIMFTNFTLAVVRLSKDPKVSVAMFVGIGLYAQTFNAVRQMLAVSFIVLGLSFMLRSKHDWIFLIFVAVASLFHITALSCVVIYILYKMKLNKVTLILITVGTILLCVGFPYVVQFIDKIFNKHYYEWYVNYRQSSLSFEIAFICVCSLCVAIGFIFRKKFKDKQIDTKEFDFFLLIFLTLVCVKIVSLCSIELFDRITYYLLPSAMFIVPIILQYFKPKTRLILTIALIIVLCFALTYLLYFKGICGVLPYKFKFC